MANEISRDKSGAAANRIPASTDIVELQSKSIAAESDTAGNIKKNSDVARSDMATQWDLDEMPNEWEPNIPTLSLPKDDDNAKESNNNNVDSKSDKSKRLDLFAVSEEMPSSLRGGLTNGEERVPVKSSLTLVSEYLQNRDLRLRETDTTRTNKKTEDIQSLKQTILRTRTSKEGIVNACRGTVDACRVHDREMVPVPSWHAEYNTCGFCTGNVTLHNNYDKSLETTAMRKLNTHSNSLRPKSTFLNMPKTSSSPIKSAYCSMRNTTLGAVTPVRADVLPSPVLRGTSPFRRAKISSGSCKQKTIIVKLLTGKSVIIIHSPIPLLGVSLLLSHQPQSGAMRLRKQIYMYVLLIIISKFNLEQFTS